MEFKEVHSDDRRTIYANTELLNGPEISIIKLNKNNAIGGCIHNVDEYWAVLDGSVEVHIKNKPVFVATQGDSGIFRKREAHMFYAYRDSIVMEYGLTVKEKEKSTKDEEMLKEVNALNG